MNFRCFVLSILACMSLSLLAPRALGDYALSELIALREFVQGKLPSERSFSSASSVSSASFASGSPARGVRRLSSCSPLVPEVSRSPELGGGASGFPALPSPKGSPSFSPARLVFGYSLAQIHTLMKALTAAIASSQRSLKFEDACIFLDDLALDGAKRPQLKAPSAALVAQHSASGSVSAHREENSADVEAVLESIFESEEFKVGLSDSTYFDRFA